MDSRKEAERIYDHLNDSELNRQDDIIWLESQIALLTAEPAPCEDAESAALIETIRTALLVEFDRTKKDQPWMTKGLEALYDIKVRLLDAYLLSAEPEPCASALAVATRIEELSTSYRRREIRTKEEMYARSAELIDDYASRREQEASADERRRDAELARRKVREWKMTRTIPSIDEDELYAAILQGTEPAEYVESNEDRDERLRVKQELGAGCHDEMRYNEPAKVSEDVERDIEAVHSSLDVLRGILDSLDTSGDCYTSEDAIQAIGALYRLVSRIKEGNRG